MPDRDPSERAVLFAGGGTGGHILPAVAIAEQLLAIDPAIRLAFATSDKPIDRTSLDAALPPKILHPPLIGPIPARPPGLRPLRILRFIKSWGPSVRTAREMYRALPAQTVTLALGGYVAPPVVQAARIHNRPVAVLNIDAVPGKANRWIKRRAAAAFTTYDMGDSSWQQIAPIVRQSVLADDPHESRKRLGLDPAMRTLLITGGSQGARTINEFILAFLDAHASSFDGWQVLHQTGEGREDIREAYERANVRAVCAPFFDSMRDCWGAASLTLARAGAGTVSEAWANRVPAIFMPYPFHRDNHQRANAQPLAAAGSAIVAHDEIDPAKNLLSAGPILLGLLRSPDELGKLAAAASKMPMPDGARVIAEKLTEMASDAR